ncbi:MAG TPA: hypothetical protein VF867_17860 [Arthrobacter sp.]
MADLNFGVRPIELADALYNAVELSAETGGPPGCPHVLISYQPDASGTVGAVVICGVSRIVAGKTTIILETQAPDSYASVAIHREKAGEIQSVLRTFGRGKSTRVGVRICEEGFDVVEFDDEDEPVVATVNLMVTKDDAEVAALADSDPEGKWDRHFDMIDEYLIGSGAPLLHPALLSFDALKRVLSLKGLEARAVDIAMTKRENVLALAAGPHFRGVIGCLDREAYVAHDGARASHLL